MNIDSVYFYPIHFIGGLNKQYNQSYILQPNCTHISLYLYRESFGSHIIYLLFGAQYSAL